ncbi:acyl-CoA thioesterase-1 [Natronospira proteinivora]|uniref:Acyl-CoA thioesterase-1 n=1 Tax=Natronospira proteinivora TaxID=1807133 RepID=A0ABT1GAQ3_9GAMM|nr:arylesterase [Natronospira proteinivora]MCP1727990.1 acyl-CoA thioesterase-1 [Natronospira proteinivora]
MPRLLSLITAALLLFVALPAPSATASEGPILVIGDSLSADYGFDRGSGWVSLLEDRLREQDHDRMVINAAISGDTTRSGRARLPEALSEYEPAIVIIQLGGNDGLRGLPIEEARSNLDTMIETALAAEARVILVGVRMPPNYGRRYTEAFAQMYQDLAEHHDIVLVPRVLEGVAEREDLMQSDGIHPTAEAQPIILDNIWSALKGLLTDPS